MVHYQTVHDAERDAGRRPSHAEGPRGARPMEMPARPRASVLSPNTKLMALPWVIALTAALALLAQLLGGRESANAEPRRVTDTVEVSSRLAAQEARVEQLASKIDAVAARQAKAGANPKLPSAQAPAPMPDPRADSAARSLAAVEADLDKLRQYVKDVSDSIAAIDAQVSDPALLQKKVERQKLLLRP